MTHTKEEIRILLKTKGLICGDGKLKLNFDSKYDASVLIDVISTILELKGVDKK